MSQPARAVRQGLPRVARAPKVAGRAPEELVVFAARYVTLDRFEALSGYTPDAVHAKIKRRAWLLGREFIKAPDGRILVDLLGYGQWARGTA